MLRISGRLAGAKFVRAFRVVYWSGMNILFAAETTANEAVTYAVPWFMYAAIGAALVLYAISNTFTDAVTTW